MARTFFLLYSVQFNSKRQPKIPVSKRLVVSNDDDTVQYSCWRVISIWIRKLKTLFIRIGKKDHKTYTFCQRKKKKKRNQKNNNNQFERFNWLLTVYYSIRCARKFSRRTFLPLDFKMHKTWNIKLSAIASYGAVCSVEL